MFLKLSEDVLAKIYDCKIQPTVKTRYNETGNNEILTIKNNFTRPCKN